MNEQQKEKLFTLFNELQKANDNLVEYCVKEKLIQKYVSIDGGLDVLMDTILDFKEVLANLGIEFAEE